MRLSHLAAVGCAVSVTLGVAAADARADWTRPFDLSGPLVDSSHPSVGVDDSGRALFAWQRQVSGLHRVQIRVRGAGGALGPVQTISTSGRSGGRPQVEMNGAGVAAIGYHLRDGGHERLAVRVRQPSGRLSGQQLVSPRGVDVTAFELGIDDAGRVLLAWRTAGGIGAAVRATDGAVGPTTAISKSRTADDPQVAVSGAGDGIVAWTSDGILRDRTRPAGGSFSHTHTDSGGGRAWQPDVGIDATGRAVMIWGFLDSLGDTFAIHVRTRKVGGSTGPIKTVVQAGSTGGFTPADPTVAVAANGAAALAWHIFQAGPGTAFVEGAVLKPSGTLTDVVALSPNTQDTSDPVVAIDDTGHAEVVWRVAAGLSSHVTSRPLSPDGVAGRATTVSDLSPSVNEPDLAVNGAGAGAAVWHGSDETADVVQGARLSSP